MEIKKPAIAGTLESSDCQVMVEAGEGKIDLSLDSAVINQYGNQIRKVVLETLFFGLMPILISIAGEFGVEATHIAIVMVVCRNCATFISLVVPATFLGVGLAGVEIKDHIKKCFFWIWGCQHYLSDIRTDPGCDQIIDIINAGLKGIGSAKRDRSGWAGPFSLCFVGLMHQAAVTRSFSWTERPQ